jgi:cobaltochelatase CobT
MSDNPADKFKQALAESARTLAGEPDLEVSYSQDPAGVSGRRMRLPPVSRRLKPEEVKTARGEADAMALRLRYHDASAHSYRMPQGDMARGIYDALETARSEALGARAMPGVATNLDANLRERGNKANWAGLSDPDDAPLADACALALRAAATGRPLPKSAANLVRLFGDKFDENSASCIASLIANLDDQDAFAKDAWGLIEAMGYGDELGAPPDETDFDDDQSSDDDDQQEDDGEDGESQDQGDEQDDAPPEASDEDASGEMEELAT